MFHRTGVMVKSGPDSWEMVFIWSVSDNMVPARYYRHILTRFYAQCTMRLREILYTDTGERMRGTILTGTSCPFLHRGQIYTSIPVIRFMRSVIVSTGFITIFCLLRRMVLINREL